MEQILHTVLNIGIEKPFKILHITDVHLTEANEQDTPEHHELMDRRRVTFHKEGSCPPGTPKEYFAEAIRLAEEMGALLVCTGDAIDIHTHGNIAEFHRIADGHDMMFSPGGHEHQRVCVRTMEEPYPYFETIRPKLKAAFPEFDMDFDSRVVNGVNVITADNSMDYFNAVTLERFKAELDKGLPVVVFFHDPIWDSLLQKTEPYHPNIRLTPEDYQRSHEMIDLLINHPLVVATIAGHNHREEEQIINGKTHYSTPGLFKGICRLVEIR